MERSVLVAYWSTFWAFNKMWPTVITLHSMVSLITASNTFTRRWGTSRPWDYWWANLGHSSRPQPAFLSLYNRWMNYKQALFLSVNQEMDLVVTNSFQMFPAFGCYESFGEMMNVSVFLTALFWQLVSLFYSAWQSVWVCGASYWCSNGL